MMYAFLVSDLRKIFSNFIEYLELFMATMLERNGPFIIKQERT